MKKINKIILGLALVMILAMPLLSGCSLSDLFGGSSQKNVLEINIVGTIQTEYVVGENFNANGTKIEIVYEDETTKQISLDKSMTNFDSRTIGEKDLTVTYEGKVKTLSYRVDAFKLVRIGKQLNIMAQMVQLSKNCIMLIQKCLIRSMQMV